MLSKAEVEQAIFEAIDEVNALLPIEMQLKRSANADLFGPKGNLDSLGLINLMVALERRLENQAGVEVNVADERAMSRPNEIFRTVETLSNYVYGLLNSNESS